MKKQAKMKSAVITSIIAMLLSIAMLFGTTFAWFTDSVTNTNNIIKSGNLDVELWHCSSADANPAYGFGYYEPNGAIVEGNTQLFLNTEGKQVLWEPGAEVGETFRIKNMGSLALKFELRVKSVYETETEDGKKLSDVLSVQAIYLENDANGVPGTPQGDLMETVAFGDGYIIKDTLLAGEAVDYWVSIGWTPSEKDNEYNVAGGLSLVLGIELVATQTTFEKDGYNGDIYDKDAEFPVVGGVSTFSGKPDYSWIENNTDAEIYVLNSADALMGLKEIVDGNGPATYSSNGLNASFKDKTIVLNCDVDLYREDENGEPVCFEPIGSYRFDQAFKGTFDGNGHTIKNLNQNTWALNNGYYYGDLGLGLFGLVEDATIKNVTVDGVNISGESAMCGTIAAAAYGDCVFENITIKNANVADYQYYAGGIVGWASGNHLYKNCVIDSSTNIAAQWGDFDNSIGGVIGGAGGSAKIFLKDCTIACRIDAYNDVTSAYRWYAYRRAGMIIGNTSKTENIDGTTYASAPQLTCENVTVIYGDWANYTYCEFAGTSYPYVRVQEGVSNSAYSNPRYGHPTDANGNEVVDDNHVHNEGEDHHILRAFDQLYGGGQGVYGMDTHAGVEIIYNNK